MEATHLLVLAVDSSRLDELRFDLLNAFLPVSMGASYPARLGAA